MHILIVKLHDSGERNWSYFLYGCSLYIIAVSEKFRTNKIVGDQTKRSRGKSFTVSLLVFHFPWFSQFFHSSISLFHTVIYNPFGIHFYEIVIHSNSCPLVHSTPILTFVLVNVNS